jgi:hypothetical protein
MANALVGILVHYCDHRNLEISAISYSLASKIVLGIGHSYHGILFDARYSELITLKSVL